MTFYVPTDNGPAYLLWVLSKGRVANLTDAQVNQLAKLTALLKQETARPGERSEGGPV